MKLSKAQQRVLTAMAEPECQAHLRRTGGAERGILWAKRRDDRVVRAITLVKLRDMGLIEDISDPDWRWRSSTYVITDTGREWLDNIVFVQSNKTWELRKDGAE